MHRFSSCKAGKGHITLLGISVLGFFLALLKDPLGGSHLDIGTWNLFVIFFCAILCILLNPFPTVVVAWIALSISIFCSCLTPAEAFREFGSPIVWLVVISFFIARAFSVTGFGRRCCYLLVERFGGSTLGLAYSVCAIEIFLAPVIPSNTARGAGVVLPVILPLLSEENADPNPAHTPSHRPQSRNCSTLLVAQKDPRHSLSDDSFPPPFFLDDVKNKNMEENNEINDDNHRPPLIITSNISHPLDHTAALYGTNHNVLSIPDIKRDTIPPTAGREECISSPSSSTSSTGSANSAGEYLLLVAYNANCVSSAAFLTGCSSCAVCADIAFKISGVELGWAAWMFAALPIAIINLILLPLVVGMALGHSNVRNPRACELARESLKKMGPISSAEKKLLVVFSFLLIFWGVGGALELADPSATALFGAFLLVVLGVLDIREHVVKEYAAFDLLMWFPALLTLANQLARRGFFVSVGDGFAASLTSLGISSGWISLLAVAGFFCASHYCFASLSAHAAALYSTSLLAAISAGAEPRMAALLLAACSPLSGCLTHFSSGPAPLYFATGLVSVKKWWTAGGAAMALSLTIWWLLGAGFWWRLVLPAAVGGGDRTIGGD